MNFILTWAVLLSFIILVYILLDGFDLGIGILFPWIKGDDARDITMSSIAYTWDGNGTWLVFGAAGLYGAFPVAYGILLPVLYMPIMLMVTALIFRGLAFEFRFKAETSKPFWDTAFALGSMVASLMQGMILGSFIQGYGTDIPSTPKLYPWITPFSVLTGIAVVLGYALLGANWLIMKTEGSLQKQMFHTAKWLLSLMTGALCLICVWVLLLQLRILDRWIIYRHLLWPVPVLTAIAVLYQFYCLNQKYETVPFFLTVALFILSYVGFAVSVWPYAIPYSVPFWEAAAPSSSLKFSLVGTAIIIPILLAYTAYSHYVFRGKVTRTIHY